MKKFSEKKSRELFKYTKAWMNSSYLRDDHMVYVYIYECVSYKRMFGFSAHTRAHTHTHTHTHICIYILDIDIDIDVSNLMGNNYLKWY